MCVTSIHSQLRTASREESYRQSQLLGTSGKSLWIRSSLPQFELRNRSGCLANGVSKLELRPPGDVPG